MTWRFLAVDTRTGVPLGELPLGGAEITERLNGGVTISGTLDLRATTASGESLAPYLLEASEPGRTTIFAERDGQLIACGIVATRERSAGSSGLVSLSCVDHITYMQHRKLTADTAFVDEDPFEVAQDLLIWAQAQDGGDVRLLVGSETSPVVITRQPLALGHELRSIAELIDELAVEAPFDWSISVERDGDGYPVARFNLHHPRRGRSAAASGVQFAASEAGGGLTDWSMVEDTLDSVSTLYGVGAGSGAAQLVVSATDVRRIDAGFPAIEDTLSLKAVSDVGALLAATTETLRQRTGIPARWSASVDPDYPAQRLGTWTVGDDVAISIHDDPAFPGGLVALQRITGQTISISDDSAPDVVTLTLGEPRG